MFTKNKEGVLAIRGMKYKKYVAGKYTRARAPLARKYANRIFESKDGTKSMKIVNYIERHNFCWNDLLTKSNRIEIQTYKVEERTFGTPCISYLVNLRKVSRRASRTLRCDKVNKIRRVCRVCTNIVLYSNFISFSNHDRRRHGKLLGAVPGHALPEIQGLWNSIFSFPRTLISSNFSLLKQ